MTTYIGHTLYGNAITLPGVSEKTSPEYMFGLAERFGVVRIVTPKGDVFRRKREGEWEYGYTKKNAHASVSK